MVCNDFSKLHLVKTPEHLVKERLQATLYLFYVWYFRFFSLSFLIKGFGRNKRNNVPCVAATECKEITEIVLLIYVCLDPNLQDFF